MFCPNCGTQNQENAQTCTKCGFSMKSAAPKFKGTMLMMNQNAAPIAGPRPGVPAAPPPAAPPPAVSHQPTGAFGPPSSIGAGAPSAGAVPPHPSRLKGTIVGVAAPAAGAAPAPPTPSFDPAPTYGAPTPEPAAANAYGAPAGGGFGAPAGGFGAPVGGGFGAPAGGGFGALEGQHPFGAPEAQHQFGAPQGANPLGATVAFDGSGGGFGSSAVDPPPAFGAPTGDASASGGYGAPAADIQAGGYGAPPAHNAYGAPPAADPYAQPAADPYAQAAANPYGAADPMLQGQGHNPNPYGSPPMGGAPGMQQNPYGAAPQDYGAQQQQQGYGNPQMMGGQQQMPPGMAGQMQPYGQQQMDPYGQQQGFNPNAMGGAMVPGAAGPQRPWLVTLLLAIFAGSFGAQRFYTGYMVFGIIQLLTCGGLGFWTLYDIIMIATGKFVDAQGRPLLKD